MTRTVFVMALATSAMILMTGAGAQEREISDNLFENPSFEAGTNERGVPEGWSLYAGASEQTSMDLVDDAADGERALKIIDGDPAAEIGVYQDVEGEGGVAYEASAMIKALRPGSAAGAYLQLRFHPSGEYRQQSLGRAGISEFTRIAVRGLAPPNTEYVRLYIYTHKDPTPQFIVDSASMVSGVEPPPPPPPPPPTPEPPVYEQLKDLHLQTDLVRDGEPQVTIVAPTRHGMAAREIAAAIEQITGVAPTIADDGDVAVPADDGQLDTNYICLGNRSTNEMIEELYNRFYTLLDLRYPGPGGSVVRTCHNPFGDGHNIIFVGGSDDQGVEAAADTLIAALQSAGGGEGALTIGRLMEIDLGEGLEFSHDPRELQIWDASRGYGSTGYFGWNSISKHAAAYYMTGDEYHARQFIRLAFPDEEAKAQIAEIDGERIENKDDPLAGPYHYNAHMMILFWDLIEESPVFTDEERLRVTNAFSRQLDWRKGEGIYPLQEPPRQVGSRHGQYSAISLYCLARYFAKDYGDPVWQQGMLGPKMHFAALEHSAWVAGESDNLFWYNTGTAPILRFMLLSGWRGPMESGNLQKLLRAQEMLITGKSGDWDLNSASITYLHRAAYLTQDGRWLEYLRRTGQDLDVPRLGQSFWPEDHLQPQLPHDMVGHWSINPLPVPMWEARGSGLPYEHSFQFGSFRSAPDASGDFILIDGFNGASRNPYHTFAILELRLDGATLLKGYRNQVLTRVDGMVEPRIAMDAALRHASVVGDVATCVGEVPNAAYCNWRRTLAQKIGDYAVVVDELTMRESSENIQVQMLWEAPSATWDEARQGLQLSTVAGPATPLGWHSIRALNTRYASQPTGAEYVAELNSLGIRLLRATEIGQYLEMRFALPEPVEGQVYADFINYTDRGVFSIALDGEIVGERYDSYAPTAQPGRADLGHHRLEAGEHTLRVEVIEEGRNERSYIGLVGLSIKPEGADEEPPGEIRYEVLTSEVVRAMRDGKVHRLEWNGEAQEGETLRFFSVVGRDITGDDQQLACLRLSDSAAALGLPEPAVAVAGEYAGTRAEMAIIAASHLYGRALTRATAEAPLLQADAPIDVHWDFGSGVMHVEAPQELTLQAALEGPVDIAMDGMPVACEATEGGLYALQIPEGKHEITGARPADRFVQTADTWLRSQREDAEAIRAEAAAAEPPGALPEVPSLPVAATANVGGAVVDIITIPDGEAGQLICAAEGHTVHILRPDGTEVATGETDGQIRMLHWWPEHELLLAGCADEKVIAFNRSGERQWTFVSEMDPAVFRAAKTYWFKSAPAHAGIWGVYTANFINGEPQAIIGSACTLEFIDGNGQLVHRMPQFWGDPHVFQIIEGPDDSLNLLAARRINGSHRVGIINNRTLDPDRRGFNAVPPGHTYVGGWSSLNRYHLFYEDLNGDGEREVISEINGSWNRVTVWDRGGTALYDASFGPGNNAPTRNMRDLVVADLDRDGTMEVVTATSSALVVALDHELKKEWARALPSPVNVMTAVETPAGGLWLVCACDDGTVAALDAGGEVVRIGQVEGRPAQKGIAVVQTADGPTVAIATAAGEVTLLRPE